MQTEVRRDRIRRVARVAALVLLALLAAYGIWAGLGAWTVQQTGWKPLPRLSPLPTGTPAPTATPGWWDSPIEVPAWAALRASAWVSWGAMQRTCATKRRTT